MLTLLSPPLKTCASACHRRTAQHPGCFMVSDQSFLQAPHVQRQPFLSPPLMRNACTVVIESHRLAILCSAAHGVTNKTVCVGLLHRPDQHVTAPHDVRRSMSQMTRPMRCARAQRAAPVPLPVARPVALPRPHPRTPQPQRPAHQVRSTYSG